MEEGYKPRPVDINKYIDVWFDPNNLEHLVAYKFLIEKGQWPIGFPPPEIQFPTGWNGRLNLKLAMAYVESKLRN